MSDHLDIEILVPWWLGELPAHEEERLEEHLFACQTCSSRAEWLAALAEDVRAVVRNGTVGMVISAPFLDGLKRAGLRLREYRLAPGDRVDCTIRADDNAVVSRIRAPIADVKRVDAVWRVEIGGKIHSEMRLEDVPFDPGTGEVVFMPSAAVLRKLPAHKQHLRLTGISETGEHPLGEYTFDHAPS